MEKTIEVCDFCEKEKSLDYPDYAGRTLCADCKAIFDVAKEDAMSEVQKEVKFSVTRRLTLLCLLRETNNVALWGSQGILLRDELIKAYENE